MADKKTEPAKVEAVSLDDWVVAPVSLDDWVVEDEADSSSSETSTQEKPKSIKKEVISSSAETITLEPQPVAVGVDDWLVEDDEEPELEIESNIEAKTEETTVDEIDLEGPIEIHEDTFSDPHTNLHEDVNQTQTLNVDLQGDLAELEESNIEPSNSDSQSHINTDDDDDLLSDIENESGMQASEASFQADEPIHAIQSEELSQSTSAKVELDLDEDSTVIEGKQAESFDLLEDPFEPDEPIPSVDSLAFPPTTMENVELDFDSETQVLESSESEISAELEPLPEPETQSDSNDIEGLDFTTGDTSDELEPLPEIEPEPEELQPLPDITPETNDIEELDFTEDIEGLDLSEDESPDELEPLVEINEEPDDIESLDLSEETLPIEPQITPTAGLAEEETIDTHDDDSTKLIESEEPIHLEQTDFIETAASTTALSLATNDLADTHWIKLTDADLASHHKLGVLKLTEMIPEKIVT